jgi:hypothetical protein
MYSYACNHPSVTPLRVELDRKKLPPEGGKIDAPPGLLDSNTLHEYR